jgi:hypothetical protein
LIGKRREEREEGGEEEEVEMAEGLRMRAMDESTGSVLADCWWGWADGLSEQRGV